MSDLYKEALIDAKKIKQIAEEEAKKQLLEKFTPFVKEMITRDLKEKTKIAFAIHESVEKVHDNSFVVGEQEEDPAAIPQATPPAALPAVPPATGGDPSAAPVPQDPASMATDAPPAPAMADPMAAGPTADPTPPLMSDPSLGAPDASASMPVEPIGSQELGSTTLDQVGEDGKITVDVNDLFSPSAPEAIASADEVMAGVDDASSLAATEDDSGSPEEMNADDEQPMLPAATEEDPEAATASPVMTEAALLKKVITIVDEINSEAMKIDLLCLKESKAKDLEKEFHKKRLFSLLEQVDSLKEKGLINEQQAKIIENKLEFLFIKLKEAKFGNSYRLVSQKKNLREDKEDMTKRSLKSIAAKLFMEEVDAIERTQAAADARVKANSQAAKSKSGNPDNVKADSEDSIPTKESETEWDKQDPNGKGVLEENAEVGDETVDASAGFGDTSENPEVEFEISEAELMEAIKQIRKESVQRKIKALKESLQECGDDDSAMMQEQEVGFGAEDDEVVAADDDSFGAEDAGFDGDVDVDSAEADLQSAFDALGIGDVDVDISLGGAEGSDDEEIEIVDDEDGTSGHEDALLADDDQDEDDLAAEMALYEAKKRKQKAASLKEAAARQVSQLKREMDENNLFTAKTVFFNKVLIREGKNLSKENTKKVVELLDKARTLKEAKEIYQKILSRLQESKSKTQTLSQGKKQQPQQLVKESVMKPAQTQNEHLISFERWQQIAGIQPKK